jgi:hypothetical protein
MRRYLSWLKRHSVEPIARPRHNQFRGCYE